jgi:hypothetical protein
MKLVTSTLARHHHRPSAVERRSTRPAPSRLAAFFLAAVMLLGALTAGRSYLWCSMMAQAVEACCCEPAGEDDGAPVGDARGGARLHAACCERHGYGDVARGSFAADKLEVPDAMPVTLAAPPVLLAPPVPAPSLVPATVLASACGGAIRAGPWAASDTCIRLQVFRC